MSLMSKRGRGCLDVWRDRKAVDQSNSQVAGRVLVCSYTVYRSGLGVNCMWTNLSELQA